MRLSASVRSREDVEDARVEGTATLLEKELVDHDATARMTIPM